MAAIVREGPVTVVELDESYDALDVAGHEAIAKLLLEQARSADPPQLVLDFSRTNYFGSSFIELLFRVWKRLRDRGGQLAVCRLSPFCGDVLRVARVESLWRIYETRAAAVAGVSAPA